MATAPVNVAAHGTHPHPHKYKPKTPDAPEEEVAVLGEELDGLHALGVARVAVHALLGEVAQMLQVPFPRPWRRLEPRAALVVRLRLAVVRRRGLGGLGVAEWVGGGKEGMGWWWFDESKTNGQAPSAAGGLSWHGRRARTKRRNAAQQNPNPNRSARSDGVRDGPVVAGREQVGDLALVAAVVVLLLVVLLVLRRAPLRHLAPGWMRGWIG